VNCDSIQALLPNEKIALACMLNALASRPETDRVTGAAPSNHLATLSWDALQSELMQAAYLHSDKWPAATQTLEKKAKHIHWHRSGSSKLDSKVISQVNSSFTSRSMDGDVESL
jgi:hypothetical protein